MAWYDYVPGGSYIDSFLHPEEGYNDAARKMQEMWQQVQGFQQPYNQAGQGQIPILQGAQKSLLDPSSLLADWMSKYETSPYAKQSLANAKESGLGAASSMGLMGSSAALGNIQQSASEIMNKDRQSYLNDLMQKYMLGTNIGQNMFNQGAGIAGGMGQQGMGMGGSMADMAYGAKASKSQLVKDMLAMGLKAFMASQGGGGGAMAGAM